MVRTVLVVTFTIVLAVALAFGGARMYVEYSLSPEDKFELRHETEPLKQKLLKSLETNPGDGETLAKLIDILVLEGNLGRAELLCRLNSIHSEKLEIVRALFAEMDAEVKQNRSLENRRRDGRWMVFVDYPLYGSFRFAQGYRYAVLGDWTSAKNEFDAIKNKKSGIKINPHLLDHVEYMLARCHQESGDHKTALKILATLKDSNKANGLRPKIYAAQLSSHLALGDEQRAEDDSKRLYFVSGYTWEKTKAHLNWGDFYSAAGRKQEALTSYIAALEADETSGTLAELAVAGALGLLTSRDDSLKIDDWNVMLLAAAAVRAGKTAEARRTLDWIIDSGADSRLLQEFLLAKVFLSLEADSEKDVEAAMTALNLTGASDDVMARALFHLGAHYAKKRKFDRADEYYLASSKLLADVSADARYRRYILMKENKAKNRYNIENAVEDLKFICDNYPESGVFVPASEELIPIYFYKNDRSAARKLADKLAGKGLAAETLRYYWNYRLASASGNNDEAKAAKEALKWRSYTYFEVAVGDAPAEREHVSKPSVFEQERVDEIFFGMGLFDLGRESAINAEWLVPDISLAVEAFARRDFGSFEDAAWHAEKLIEKGIVSDPELLRLLLDIAYPRPFEDEVRAAAARHGIDAAIIWAIMKQESGFRPYAISSAGAAGLMQLMPDTASWLIGGGRARGLGDYRKEPAANIELGAAYIAYLKSDRMAGRPLEALLGSYNAGPGNTSSWINRYPGAPGWLYAELIPNRENESFTKRVMRNYDIYLKLENR